MGATIGLLVVLLAEISFPFGLYFLAKRGIRSFYLSNPELAGKTFAVLRPANSAFQPIFAVLLILITIYLGHIQ